MCHFGTVIYKGFLCKLNENIVITPDVFPLCHSLTLFRGFRNEFQCSESTQHGFSLMVI